MSNYTSVAMLRCREPIERAEPLKNALALDFSAIGEKMSDYWFDRNSSVDCNLAIATFDQFKHLPEGYELSVHLRRDDRPNIKENWSLSMGVHKDRDYLASLSLASTSVHTVFDNIAEKAKQLVESIGRP